MSWRRDHPWPFAEVAPERTVAVVGIVLVLAHLAFRTWALAGSWFYLDDYRLLFDADTTDFTLDYLLTPYNSHLMPGGRMLARLVVEGGALNWSLAWVLIIAIQGLAGLAALWACLTLFGHRLAALIPLGLYLVSVMTLPAMMWWTAAVNQVPLQVSLFLALGSWVNHLRSQRKVWLIASLAAIVLGLAFYVKALLLFPLLAYVGLAYFVEGGPIRRLRMFLTAYWMAALAGLVVAGSYVAYYVTHVKGPFVETSASVVGDIANSLLGTAFLTGVVGGPWQWLVLAPPNSFAAPPPWSVHVAWVVVALVMWVAFALRHRTFRAWALLLGSLAASLALLVNSRGVEYGGLVGLEYRYLTDTAAVAVICVGLAFLEVPGAVESSAPRDAPLLRVAPSGGWVALLVGAIVLGSLVSSVNYVRTWHSDNASVPYMQTLRNEFAREGKVDLADGPVPDVVYPAIFAPDNQVSRFATLMSGEVKFPIASSRLGVVGPDGTLRAAVIGDGVTAKPGRPGACAWKVKEGGRDIPLTARAFQWVWWMRIGYLYSGESPVSISAGADTIDTHLLPGANSLYMRVEATFDTVRIEGLKRGTTLCVDAIEVGPVQPGGPL